MLYTALKHKYPTKMKNNGLAELERDQLCKGYWFAFEKYFSKPTDDFITN